MLQFTFGVLVLETNYPTCFLSALRDDLALQSKHNFSFYRANEMVLIKV